MSKTYINLPDHSTNLDLIPYGGVEPNYIILIKVTFVDFDCLDDLDDDEKEELEENYKGTILKIDLEDHANSYTTNEYDSEYHFVCAYMEEELAEHISDDSGWCVNSFNWVEVQEVI